MISASRRRRPDALSGEDAFALHLRIARRHDRTGRLVRGSIGALLASCVSLAFAQPAGIHALALAGGLLIGAVLPSRDQLLRALGDIRRQAGLSYETALELRAAEPATEDPFGLHAAVTQRARDTVRDVKPIEAAPWWLPVLVVAAALLFFSTLGPQAPGPTGGVGGLGAGLPLPTPTPPGEDPEDAGAVEFNAPDQAPERAEQPAEQGAAEDEDEPAGPSADAPSEGDSPGAPLSRFLDSLRERPADSPARGGDGSQEQAGQGGTPGGGQGGDREPQRIEFQETDQPGGQRAGEAGGQGDQTTQDGATTEGGEGGGEAGAEAGAANDEAGGAQDEGGEGQVNPFDQAGDPAGEGDADFETGVGEQGADGGPEGEAAEAAGGAGEGIERPAGVAEGADTDLELLPGVLGEGPESIAGTVRLPGEDEVELPEGLGLTSYARALEEALGEGDLPLSYQDIIRRYFR